MKTAPRILFLTALALLPAAGALLPKQPLASPAPNTTVAKGPATTAEAPAIFYRPLRRSVR